MVVARRVTENIFYTLGSNAFFRVTRESYMRKKAMRDAGWAKSKYFSKNSNYANILIF